MRPFYLTKLVVITTIFCALSSQIKAQSVTFGTTGGPFTYTVPAGVTAVGVDMAAGSGGNEYSGAGGQGGKGGRVQCTMAVTAGQTYYIYVGGAGGNGTSSCVLAAGGVNGGQSATNYYAGGSGGASDIRTVGGSYATGLASRLVVAGAGGASGYYCYCSSDNGGQGGGVTGGNALYGSSFVSYCGGGGAQTLTANGNASYGTTTYEGTLGYGGPTLSGCYYSGPGGAGYYGGGGGGYYCGGGGGSSYPAANGGQISNLTHTQGYQTGNGYVVLCAPNLGTVIGNTPVCVGQTISLSSTGSGGNWTSATPSIATISSTGVVTGIAAGTATISYAASVAGCGSGFLLVTVTVNPAPSSIVGTNTACIGLTSTLTDGGGGTWSSSNPTLAYVGPTTGVVTGITASTPTITYTLPVTGCYTTLPFTVNPLPASVTGSNVVCAAGATTTLTDATPAGTWTSANPANATITTGSGIVTGGAAGATTITYTLPTGCISTFNLTVNPLPGAPTGSGSVCAGSTTLLTDAGAGAWSSSNVSVASVGGTGIVTGVSAGTANITYTLTTGCSNSSPILVNPLPGPIAGVFNFCNGGTTTLSDPTPGGSWTSSNPGIATVIPSSGFVSSLASGLPVMIYTLPTSCSVSQVITINALPTPFLVTGGGAYCAGTGGVHIGLGLSTTGVNYQLYRGPVLVTTVGGSNSPLDFGVDTTAGTYTVVGINTSTACTNNMSGSTTISINPLPNAYTVTGGGNFCPGTAGADVSLSGSATGINYQLQVGGVSTGGIVAGSGAPLDFGPQTAPGMYTATAINPLTGCSKNMAGTAMVVLNTVPPIHTISAGGSYCTGGAGIGITLDGSDMGVVYQLYMGSVPVGAPVAGSGLMLSFGTQTTAGTYTIIATNTATGCVSTMSGTATISINPLPLVFFVTGGGGFCPGGLGVHVNLNYSTTGINYQLYHGSTAVTGGLIAGSNAGLDFGLQTSPGTYSVVAIDASTGCTKNMSGTANVFINPAPTSYTVTGGGNYCTGGAGLPVGLSSSNSGTTYQLWFAGAMLGAPMSGTGSALNFGIQSGVGAYTITATNSSTSCVGFMTGSANINVNPLPNIDSVFGTGTSYCAGGSGIDIILDGSDMGVNYQLYRGGAAIGSPVTGSGALLDLGMHTPAGSYTVSAVNPLTGCAATMAGVATISINPGPAVYVVTGGGNYCAGGAGVHIGLSGTTLGVDYTLNMGTTMVMTVPGTGSPMDLGLQTAGVYKVTGADHISGCASNMADSVTIGINPLPTQYTVTGTNSYCAGSTGVPVYLSASTTAIHYQLYNGSSMVGTSYLVGTGGSLNFGIHTAGNYWVMAVNPGTGCSDTMVSSAVITANPLPALQTVSAGGAYCAGGTGYDVNLGGSSMGINYQLMHAGSSIGSPMGGTGSALDFGLQTGAGSYTIVATDTTTHCTTNMTGAATISITPQPSVDTVTGGGAYCAGGSGKVINLNTSNSGITYELIMGVSAVGSLVTGTGGLISFGTFTGAGTYTVIASPGGLCQTSMAGNATISINPLPTIHNVTGGGGYCANDSGSAVTLNGSNTGIRYQLYLGTSMVGSFVAGSGSPISFGLESAAGIYTVVATNALTGCTSNMASSATVSVIPVPVVYNVSGGGPYCAGGAGSDVLLNSSSTDVNYQLYLGGSASGTPVAGTGTAIDFGMQTTAGSYTIIGTDAATLCTSNMADTVSVTIMPVVTPVINSITATPGLSIKMGQTDTFTVSVTNGGTSGPLYQWKVNSFPVSGATNSTFISNEFNNNDVISCDVTSTGMCGDVTVSSSKTITVRNTVNVNQVTAGIADVTVIPNPNKGIFNVTGSLGTSDDVAVTLEVMDVVGHVIYSQKVIANGGKLNEHVQLNGNLANGMYLLNLRSDVANQVFHIVVEK